MWILARYEGTGKEIKPEAMMSQPGVYFSPVPGDMAIPALKDRRVIRRQPTTPHEPLPPKHSCNSSAASLWPERRLQGLSKKRGVARGEGRQKMHIDASP